MWVHTTLVEIAFLQYYVGFEVWNVVAWVHTQLVKLVVGLLGILKYELYIVAWIHTKLVKRAWNWNYELW